MTGVTYLAAHRLAVGGMAEVLLARQQGLAGFERLVVVKRVREQLKNDKRFIDMFLNEARLAAQLGHPNIVEIQDVVREDDDFYIVMEYVSGEDLRVVVRETARRSQRIPAAVACRVVADAASALDYAHNATDLEGNPLGVIHRDVSPSNIIVTYAGETKLVDFGLANANIHNIYTKPGTLKGKYAYSSPELVQHEEADPRSDVFSLAVVLHELLSFRRLFRGKNPNEVVKAVMEAEIPPPSRFNEQVSPELDRAVLRALERDRDQRTPSAGAFLEELEAAVQGTQLSVGTYDVARWMERTLAKRHAQRSELERAAATADPSEDITANERPPLLGSADGSDSGAGTPFPSSSGIGGSSDQQPQEGKGRGLMVAAAAVLLLAVVGGAFWMGFNRADRPDEPTPSPKPGAAKSGFDIRVQPEGARVVVDGELITASVGPDPVFIPAEPGSAVELEVIKGGYESHFETLEASGEPGTAELAVTLAPVASDDAGVQQARGEPVDAGEARASPQSSDRDSAGRRARRQRAAASARRAREEEREPEEGTLVIQYEPADAVLSVDGTVRAGTSPQRLEGLSPGQHRIRLEAPGHASLDRRVEVQEGTVAELAFELSEKTSDKARVDVITVPAGAQVTVDGRPRGTSPAVGLSLEAGEVHRISAELDGYRDYHTRMLPEPGDNPPLVATLEPVERETASAPEPERPSDIRVPLSMSGSASAGRALFRSGCGKCHGRSAPAISPDRYTQAAWSRYFATGRHTRRAPFRPHFSRSQLADIKAFLMANAADVESDVAAGVR